MQRIRLLIEYQSMDQVKDEATTRFVLNKELVVPQGFPEAMGGGAVFVTKYQTGHGLVPRVASAATLGPCPRP